MSAEIKLIVVATIDHNETKSLNNYLSVLSQLYEVAGVKNEAHYQIDETYLGQYNPDFISVMTFPDYATFESIYKGPRYQQLLPLRDKAFKTIEAYITKVA